VTELHPRYPHKVIKLANQPVIKTQDEIHQLQPIHTYQEIYQRNELSADSIQKFLSWLSMPNITVIT
jgi:hypothetical protein